MNQNTRFVAIDLARGIAMLGVALFNVAAFAVGWSASQALNLANHRWDIAAEYFVGLGFAHRSYPLLAFLFGVGLAWQWDRLPVPTQNPKALRPRLWALGLLGLLLALTSWPGEILSTYAIVGLAIGRNLVGGEPAKARKFAIVLLVVSALAMVVIAIDVGVDSPPPTPYGLEPGSFAMQSAWDAQMERLREYFSYGLLQVLLPNLWGFALLGVWAGRSGTLARFLAQPFAFPSLAFFAVGFVVIGLVVETLASFYGGWDATRWGSRGHAAMLAVSSFSSLGAIWLWLTAATFWSRSATPERGLASLIIAAGRAPLTQFFGQSIVFAMVFNKSLIGWHGELGRFAYSMIAIATYVLLSGFIRAWLASGHAHGPMETLWRDLTRRFSPPRLDKSPVESTPA